MLAKDLDQILEVDLISLEREQVAESIRIEFKRQGAVKSQLQQEARKLQRVCDSRDVSSDGR